MPNTHHVGIDFGTSFSTLAYFDTQLKRPELILNAEGEMKTPSVVCYVDGEVLVGKPALERLEDNPDAALGFLPNVKRDLGKKLVYPVPGRPVTPVDVVAEILRKLKQDAENGHFHAPVTQVTLTHPATFDALQKAALEEAARLAGFEEIELVPEPVAAARAYIHAGKAVGERLLVYDLGGGTFDVSVLEKRDGQYVDVALDGLRIGGADFDEALYQYFNAQAQRELQASLERDGRRDQKFLRLCCQKKERLSDHQLDTKPIRVGDTYLFRPDGNVAFRPQIDRRTFEELVRDLVAATIRRTREVVAKVGKPVDTVVLIGGSTRIPLIQTELHKALAVKPLSWQHCDVAVALGAAVRKEYESLFDLGCAYLQQAEATKSWSDRVEPLTHARVWFDKALEINPSYHQAAYALGKVLVLLSKHTDGAKRAILCAEVCAIFDSDSRKGTAICDAEALCYWGEALSILAERSADDDEGSDCIRMLARSKLDAAIELSPGSLNAKYLYWSLLKDWGRRLCLRAVTMTGAASTDLLESACEKYEAALRILPTADEVLHNCGNAYLNRALQKSGSEADELYTRACEKYEAALRIQPDEYAVLHNCGNAYLNRALQKSGPEADELYTRACEKYDAALRVQPDECDVLHNCGFAFMKRAEQKSGAEANRLRHEAMDRYLRAEELVPGCAAYDLACNCAIDGREQECPYWITKSLYHGNLPSKQHLLTDPDLESVRNLDWFHKLIANL